MTTGRRGGRGRMARAWSAAAVCVLALAGCSAQALADGGGKGVEQGGKPVAGATGKERPKPSAPPLKSLTGAHINIADGQTVGVGMPVSVTFDHPIPVAERADVERQLKVTAEAEGSWGGSRTSTSPTDSASTSGPARTGSPAQRSPSGPGPESPGISRWAAPSSPQWMSVHTS